MWVCGPSMSVVVRQRFIRRAGWRGDGLAQVVRALSSGSPSGPGRLPMPLRFAGAAPSLLRSVGAAAPLARENGRGCRGGAARPAVLKLISARVSRPSQTGPDLVDGWSRR